MIQLSRTDARRVAVRAQLLDAPRRTETPVERMDVGEAGEPAVVAGVPGTWRVDSGSLDKPFRGRAPLLSPLDRLVYDSSRC